MAMHVGCPSEALQVSTSSTPTFPSWEVRAAMGQAGDWLGLVCELRSPRLDFRCECVSERQRSHPLTETFLHSFPLHLFWHPELKQTWPCPPKHPLYCGKQGRAGAEGGWDLRKGSLPGGGGWTGGIRCE